jgi:hypothetical protein
MTTHVMVEGTTEPQDFQLTENGAALDGTDWTIGLDFREDVSGVTAEWLDQAAGTVRVDGLGELPTGFYHVRFTLTDGASIAYVPSRESNAQLIRIIRR